ncbi:MAG TPA: nucleotidyltransferase domain-containing protein [Anaerolineae bacterium]|nr:nucleotidyltransferase domain-containing protein [Anaerolineae bacterium]
MKEQEEVKARYWAALDKLTAQLEADYYVLAAVLYGSLARGEPWEKSDIDLMIVLRDDPQNRAPEHAWMTTEGINVFASLYPRNAFKRALEGTLQGSVLHSVWSQFRLLFTKDESIAAWLSESARIGERDRPFQLLRTVADVLYPLEKAQKWLYAKHDVHYSFLWTLHAANTLARVEVVLSGEAPGREALDQALKLNPDFFRTVYLDLIDGPKTEPVLAGALKQLDDYLVERAETLFAPVLDYLGEEDSPRTATDLNTHFAKKVQTHDLGFIYDWLADHGFIEKLASPIHLTRKSQVTVEEPAYYYDRGPADWQ